MSDHGIRRAKTESGTDEPARSPPASWSATRSAPSALASGHRRAAKRDAARRAVELPGLRPAPDRRPHARRLRGWRTSTAIATSTSTWASARCSPATAIPSCARPSRQQLDDGTLFVTPCELNADVAELLARALRAADVAVHQLRHRGDDGRHPRRPRRHRSRQDRQGRGRLPRPSRRGDDLDEAAARRGRSGRRADRRPGHGAASPTRCSRDTIVIPYNDPDALERVLARGDVAALHRRAGDGEHRHLPARPGLPRGGARDHRSARHDADLRRGQDRHHRRLGRGDRQRSACSPTSSRWPSRIGGGLPLGAFGGSAGVHGPDHRGQGAAPRHVQRQPARDGGGQGRARRGLHARGDRCRGIDRNRRLRRRRARRSSTAPACRPTPCSSGAKGCITWSPTPVRNYRDYKATDFDLAFAQWIHGINRGVLLPPGLDEQWLISVHAHRRRRAALRRRVRRVRRRTD